MRVTDGDRGAFSETQTGRVTGGQNKYLPASDRGRLLTGATSDTTIVTHLSTLDRLDDTLGISGSGNGRNLMSLDAVIADVLTNTDALTDHLVIRQRPWREGSPRTTGQVSSLCPKRLWM